MGRPKKQEGEVRVQLNAMVVPTVAKEIEAIAIFHHFTKSRAAELLVMRGLAAE